MISILTEIWNELGMAHLHVRHCVQGINRYRNISTNSSFVIALETRACQGLETKLPLIRLQSLDSTRQPSTRLIVSAGLESSRKAAAHLLSNVDEPNLNVMDPCQEICRDLSPATIARKPVVPSATKSTIKEPVGLAACTRAQLSALSNDALPS